MYVVVRLTTVKQSKQSIPLNIFTKNVLVFTKVFQKISFTKNLTENVLFNNHYLYYRVLNKLGIFVNLVPDYRTDLILSSLSMQPDALDLLSTLKQKPQVCVLRCFILKFLFLKFILLIKCERFLSKI